MVSTRGISVDPQPSPAHRNLQDVYEGMPHLMQEDKRQLGRESHENLILRQRAGSQLLRDKVHEFGAQHHHALLRVIEGISLAMSQMSTGRGRESVCRGSTPQRSVR